MKRTIAISLGMLAAAGLLAIALKPAAAQAPAAATGKIHGHVTNPTGEPQGGGSICLSTDGGTTYKFTFPVSANGDYSGEATPGTYMVIYRAANTPPGQMVDSIRGIKVEAGGDVLTDLDMSRQEYIDKMSPEQKKQLEELKKQNSAALAANKVINAINADIRTFAQDNHDAEAARATAIQQLGAGASKADVEAKMAEIQTAKYTEMETLMTRDTGLKPEIAVLWANLGRAEIGLKKYDQAEVAYKKALDLESTSKKPEPEVIGASNSGLGEIYARTGKAPDAIAAYDAASKANPVGAGLYLRNAAVIFSQIGNADASAQEADKAIQADPKQPLNYYLKGQGLISKATVDAQGKLVFPPGCLEAYQKYLELAPNGPYANDVKGILAQSSQTIQNNYGKTGKK